MAGASEEGTSVPHPVSLCEVNGSLMHEREELKGELSGEERAATVCVCVCGENTIARMTRGVPRTGRRFPGGPL